MAEGKGVGEPDIVAQIIARAWKEPSFKQWLISDPRTALREQFNLSVPAGTEIIVLEESKSQAYFVLPPTPSAASEAISDRELAELASGHTAQTVCTHTWTAGWCGPAPRDESGS